MLQNNLAKAIDIVRESSDLLGIDFIDSKFSLFVNDAQNSSFWKTLLTSSVEKVQQDYYNYLTGQFQESARIRHAVVDDLGYYVFPTFNIPGSSFSTFPIYRIIRVKYGNNILYEVDSLDALTQDTYIQQPFSIKTVIDYPYLDILYLSINIFTKVEGNAIFRFSELQNDGDIILLDKYLIIYKICQDYCGYKGLDGSEYAKNYQERLTYLIEESQANKQPIRL